METLTATAAGHINGELDDLTDIDQSLDHEEASSVEDTAVSAPNSKPNSPKGRGKGRGRPALRAKSSRVTKPAQKKQDRAPLPDKGRGRRPPKVYESAKASASHERKADITSAFSALAQAQKTALNVVANRTLQSIEDGTIDDKIREGDHLHQVLDQHAQRVQEVILARHKMELNMKKTAHEKYITCFKEGVSKKIAELCEEEIDALIAQLDRLEYVRRHGLHVDLISSVDDGFIRKPITQEAFDNTGSYVEVVNGTEVPCSKTSLADIMTKLDRKRKAEYQPPDQPASKAAAMGKEDSSAPLARHPGGLLSAVDTLDRADSPSSIVATPGPDAQSGSPTPETQEQSAASSSARPDSGTQDPLLHRAAGPADEYGVRIITRRNARDWPNNRMVVPTAFEWEEDEIGFRDSTNAQSRGATRSKRQQYYETPNTNFWHLDRKNGTYDATEGYELDLERVAKHKLHPKYGFFLPGSVNVQEPQKPQACGTRPIVFVAPDGRTRNTSRSVKAILNARRAQIVCRNWRLQSRVQEWAKENHVPEKKIQLTQQEIEAERRRELERRGLNPDQIVLYHVQAKATEEEAATKSVADEDDVVTIKEEEVAASTEHDARNIFAAEGLVRQLLEAATVSEGEPSRRESAAEKPTPSRPYDAVRDIFAETTATPRPVAPAARPPVGLLMLADLLEMKEESRSREQPERRLVFPPRSSPGRVARGRLAAGVDGAYQAASPVRSLPRLPAERPGSPAAPGPVRPPSSIHVFSTAPSSPIAAPPPDSTPATVVNVTQINSSPGLHKQAYAQIHSLPDLTNLDPRLFGPSTPINRGQSAPGPTAMSVPEPALVPAPMPPSMPASCYAPVPPAPPPRSNDFLRTALNPQPEDYGPLAPVSLSSAGNSGRTPFSNAHGGHLPTLRLMGRPDVLDESSQSSPPGGVPISHVQQHDPMAPNHGFYYPPALPPPPPPPPRPYHGGHAYLDYNYLPHEPPPIPPPPFAQPTYAPVAVPPHGTTRYHVSPPNFYATPAYLPVGQPSPQHPHSQPPAPPMRISQPSRMAQPKHALPTMQQAQQTGHSPGSGSKYRKLEPAPLRNPVPRPDLELRTVPFDYEAIKDYKAVEAPPTAGPARIRGWAHNNVKRGKGSA